MARGLAIGLGVVLVLLAALFLVLRNPSLPREEVIAKYSSDASQFIEIDGGATAHVRDEGNPDGPVLVLIHGSNASLHTWEPWVAELGDTFRIISLDLPAHGLTGAVPGTPYDSYDIDAMADFVDAVLREMAVDRFALAGNSMGGRVSWIYALAHQEKLTHLILVDASGFPRTDDGQGSYVFRLLGTPIVGQILTQITPRTLFEDGLKAAFTDDSYVTGEMVDLYRDLSLMEGTREANLIRYRTYGEDDRYKRLDEITVPTLIMWGEDDELVPVGDAWRFDSLIPNSTVTIYTGVGHIPMEEHVEQSAADVREFLEPL